MQMCLRLPETPRGRRDCADDLVHVLQITEPEGRNVGLGHLQMTPFVTFTADRNCNVSQGLPSILHQLRHERR